MPETLVGRSMDNGPRTAAKSLQGKSPVWVIVRQSGLWGKGRARSLAFCEWPQLMQRKKIPTNCHSREKASTWLSTSSTGGCSSSQASTVRRTPKGVWLYGMLSTSCRGLIRSETMHRPDGAPHSPSKVAIGHQKAHRNGLFVGRHLTNVPLCEGARCASAQGKVRHIKNVTTPRHRAIHTMP